MKLKRIDVLRTVRRKDAPESSIEDRAEISGTLEGDKGKEIRGITLVLGVVVVVLVLCGVWSGVGRGGKNENGSTVFESFADLAP